MIYTTCFHNVKRLPQDVVPVAITLYPPQTWGGEVYRRLTPSDSILWEYKRDKDIDRYVERFNKEILGKLNQESVVRELGWIGENVALICFEQPGEFCHRHLVAEWLRSKGYKVEEFDASLRSASRKGERK